MAMKVFTIDNTVLTAKVIKHPLPLEMGVDERVPLQ